MVSGQSQQLRYSHAVYQVVWPNIRPALLALLNKGVLHNLDNGKRSGSLILILKGTTYSGYSLVHSGLS